MKTLPIRVLRELKDSVVVQVIDRVEVWSKRNPMAAALKLKDRKKDGGRLIEENQS